MQDETIITSMKNTLRMESEALLEVLDRLDGTSALRAVRAIMNCPGTIHVSGCGTSGQAARKIAHTLNCINCPAAFLTPSDAVHGALGAVRNGDVAVLISKGGNTTEIAAMLSSLRRKGATVIGVTEKDDSTLGKASDILLKAAAVREPDEFNMLATSSTLSVIAMFDAIAVAIMKAKGFTREAFGVIHPGGAVGERLLGNKP